MLLLGKKIRLPQQSIQTIILLATTAEQDRFKKNCRFISRLVKPKYLHDLFTFDGFFHLDTDTDKRKDEDSDVTALLPLMPWHTEGNPLYLHLNHWPFLHYSLSTASPFGPLFSHPWKHFACIFYQTFGVDCDYNVTSNHYYSFRHCSVFFAFQRIVLLLHDDKLLVVM